MRQVVAPLDRVWSSLTRVGIELRTLSMWPLQIERYGDYGLRATARVLLKTAEGRADVIFLLSEEVLRTWPAKVFQLGFEVDIKYGTATYVPWIDILRLTLYALTEFCFGKARRNTLFHQQQSGTGVS